MKCNSKPKTGPNISVFLIRKILAATNCSSSNVVFITLKIISISKILTDSLQGSYGH